MPKINEYINTNPKPIETVYEIKNKTLSFEEFMKSYQADENLNYNDLDSGSVGEVGGYGPCYKNCGYANPDCACYMSASEGRYVLLYLACPAPRYERPYCTDKSPGSWTHGGGCGGRAYINTNLMIKCMKPGCGATFKATDASFACSSHRSEYSRASKSEFGNALTALNSLWSGKSPLIKAYIEKMMEKQLQEEGFYYE
ncbi:MAG: hypothetical protein MRERC_12c002 [Mycoplasmataceae bacterium RC_NB112A]|nr:MAG: hypothetical protein MRERC_12c002 [Mycoplasmataceae bacterium RC_NB112A]